MDKNRLIERILDILEDLDKSESNHDQVKLLTRIEDLVSWEKVCLDIATDRMPILFTGKNAKIAGVFDADCVIQKARQPRVVIIDSMTQFMDSMEDAGNQLGIEL